MPADMPRRPRAHELETDSRNVFRAALPSQWVAREITSDYGLDEHVEIFTTEGDATGRAFLAQLKGTDEVELHQALRMRLKRTTVNYLAEQDLPVLLVRYHAPSGELYTRWFHSFDPHYGQRDESRTVTYRLSPQDAWNEGTPEDLVRGVEAFRTIRQRRLELPLSVSIEVSTEGVAGRSPADIRLELRQLSDRVRDIAVLEPIGNVPNVVRISVSSEKTVVNPGGALTVTLHHTFDYQDGRDERIPADIWMALALWLGHYGDVNTAARVASAFGARSNVLTDPPSQFRILGFFVRAHRVREALELAEELWEGDPDLAYVADLIQAVAVVNSSSLSDRERGVVENFLRRRAHALDALPQSADSAASHYTLGNFLRRSGKHAEALESYCVASRRDPNYWERPYFSRELAGILFLMERYENSAHFYEVALGLEADERTLALHADALLHSGQYESALFRFTEYLGAASDPAAEFQLKAGVLPVLVQRFGPTQDRDAAPAMTFATADPAQSETAAVRHLARALELDALCGLAWFNSGVALNRLGQTEDALFAFLMAALTQTWDVEAWSNSFGLSLALDEMNMGVAIFEAGFHLNGANFVDALRANAFRQREGFDQDGYLQAIDELVAAMPVRVDRPLVRFLGEGADFEEFDFGRPEPES